MKKAIAGIAVAVVMIVGGANATSAYDDPHDPCSGYEAIVKDKKGNWVYNPKWVKCNGL